MVKLVTTFVTKSMVHKTSSHPRISRSTELNNIPHGRRLEIFILMKPTPFRNARPVFSVGGQTKQSNHEVVSDGEHHQNQRELRKIKRGMIRLIVNKYY